MITAGFGPTLAHEKLTEIHNLDISVETLRHWMSEDGLWVPRARRHPRIQQPRRRRSCRGELIQIDGCDHEWFEDRGPRCTALVFVDDATSALMELLFCESESAFSYFTATREYLEQYGRPVALYSDKAGVSVPIGDRRRLVLPPPRRVRVFSSSTSRRAPPLTPPARGWGGSIALWRSDFRCHSRSRRVSGGGRPSSGSGACDVELRSPAQSLEVGFERSEQRAA